MVIGHKVGEHLVDFCVLLNAERHITITLGRASLDGFKRLERLQIPLEMVSCNLKAAASESLVQDLISASITRLSFMFFLERIERPAIFHDFSAVKAQAPSLKEIHLTLPAEGNRAI